MQIFVRSIAGTVPVAISAQETVAILKAKAGVASNASLFFAGQCLEDSKALAAYMLQKESTVECVVPLEGGKGKKKKKRIFTKPKKDAHKHKLEKMRVLKYYKVVGDGDDVKVERLRTECTNCGAGVFMAKHKDRQTCGKCTMTYLKK